MIEQNGLIGLLYCGLVAIASLCKAKWKKKKKIFVGFYYLVQITMTNKRLKYYNNWNITYIDKRLIL